MNRRQLAVEAARWILVFKDNARLDVKQCRAFIAWLQRSDLHVAAFLQAVDLDKRVDQSALPERTPESRGKVINMFDRIPLSVSTPPTVPVEPTLASPRFSRRQLLAAGVGALTVTGGTAAILGAMSTASEDVIDSGHVLRIPLVSGVMYAARYSDVHIDERQPVQSVSLTRGQFAFNLQHASGQSTRVTTTLCAILSTAAAEFAVTLIEAVSQSAVIVTVARGVIELLPTAPAHPSGLIILKAGQKLILRAGLSGPQPLTVADPQHDLAWTKGILFFKGESINEAALRFNRFNDRRIIVAPSIADVSVGSARAPLNNPHRFVDQFVAAWPDKVRKEVRGKFIYLIEK